MIIRTIFPLLVLLACNEGEAPAAAEAPPAGVPEAPAPAPGPAPMIAADAPPPPPADGASPTGVPPADGTAMPPLDGSPPPPNDPSAKPTPPGMSSLIVDGKTVTVSGKLVGHKTGQIDIQTVRKDGAVTEPVLLEIVKVTDGTFSFKAPATFDRPLYLTAIVQVGATPSPQDLGGASDPIKLEGKDVAVELTLSKDPAWLKKLPWGSMADQAIGSAPKPGAPPSGLSEGAPQKGAIGSPPKAGGGN